jgi:hypothetical protein
MSGRSDEQGTVHPNNLIFRKQTAFCARKKELWSQSYPVMGCEEVQRTGGFVQVGFSAAIQRSGLGRLSPTSLPSKVGAVL